jgi:TonB family protein
MRNIKLIIMKTKPLVTDQELESYMDFNGLMKSYQAHKKGKGFNHLTKKIYWILGSLVTVTLLLIIYFNSPTSTSLTDPPDSLPANRKSDPNEAIPSPDSLTVFEERTESTYQNPEQPEKSSKRESETSVKNQTKATTSSETVPYVPASPKEGYEALYKYLNDALTYPKENLKDSVQGITTISFIINPDGKVDRISVEHSLGPAFDREAIRVIEQMPEWNPAMMNGKPVPSKLSLPLTFQIKKLNSHE